MSGVLINARTGGLLAGCMRRRSFLTFLGAAVVWPRTVTAQSPSKVYRIGLLSPGPPVADNSPFGAALIRGFAQKGELNRNLTFERRGAEAHMGRLRRLVDELVASKVDIIVTLGYPPALAAKQGTTLPVVGYAALRCCGMQPTSA